ncbi:MAG: (2Fe-2S)-binding protein, partial [Sedimentisphaerales bacterium]|nr:(2Fe-2S)-binding protein [Sedimentisphaerales bacterium]
MIMQSYKIHFQPDDITIVTEAGQSLLVAAQQAGIIINSVCGGAGTCNKCLVEIDGQVEPVRACQFYVEHDLVVNIPESSRFFEQKILQEGINRSSCLDPQVAKYFVQLSEPTLDDLRSDAQRLTDAVKEAVRVCRSENEITADTVSGTAGENIKGTADYGLTIDFALLPKLPGLLRDNDYAVTALCHGRRIIDLEPGDTTDKQYGLAVDIGTTTVVAELVDLTNGKETAVASESNPQIAFGDDVIGRIEYSRTHKDGLQQLRERITEGINQLIAEVCEKSGIDRRHIYELTAAGNSTMQQLFLGIPVEPIGQAPYVSAVTTAVNVPAVESGINISPVGNVYVMPTVAAHVGGDTVAVALSTAMGHSEKNNLG